MPQLVLPSLLAQETFPEIEVHPLSDLPLIYEAQLNSSRLSNFTSHFEVWSNNSSSRDLAYLTHRIFRYFGKFPPPIARHLIKTYTRPGELVVDCMCGSGTTGLECLLLNRKGFLSDINPLAILLSKVKTTRLELADSLEALEQVHSIAELNLKKSIEITLPGLRNPDHWFLPETKQTLGAIRAAIFAYDAPAEIRDFLLVVFASIVRRVSRATTQQGRLFLDKVTAIENALPVFLVQGKLAATTVAKLPPNKQIQVRQLSLLNKSDVRSLPNAPLVICHPPYFNLYRYSSVNSLELAWLGYSHDDVRSDEVREAFKLGKLEKLQEYIDDMAAALRHITSRIRSGATIALMIGDTRIHDQHIPVTANLFERISDLGLEIDRVAIRIPKGTEASWVTSQRRKSGQVGVSLCDYVVILNKV